jgi:hypothetical protein
VDLNTLPKVVRRFYASMEFIGHPIEVERLGGGWRLVMASDRVRVTIDFTPNRLGKTDWSSSTLVVDGQEHPLANDPSHLKAIFDNPGGTRDLGPLPEPVNSEKAPLKIREDYRYMAEALEGKATVVLGHEGNVWIIALDADETQVRVGYHVHRDRFQQSIDVVQDGVDRTHEVGGDMAKMMAILAKPSDSAAPAQAPGKTAASPRSNAVETRRATVIRN